MKKKELRELYRQKRKDIADKERMKMDDLLLIQFQKMSFEGIQTLFTYWPMRHTAEPNTLLFTYYLRHAVENLLIAYPVTDIPAASMQAVLTDEHTYFEANAYGIAEPTDGETLDPADIDMIFLPLLICDKKGNRVGYGKGFYDRYLSQCKEDVVKIGFSFFEPVELIEDVHEFDIPLNFCITPEAIYEY